MGLGQPSVYLDSCLAIYLVEENPSYVSTLENALAANSKAAYCISPLTEMECLIVPFRVQNNVLIAKFENWFQTMRVLPLESEVFHAAARLRGDFASLKTPDALHLATAVHHGCDEFWTNDNRLISIAPPIVKKVI